MVPTSTSRAPARAMMSGRRNDAADLDQLAARDDGILAGAEGVEHQQHRAGVVVDDARILGAGQLADQAAHVVVALAARAAADVELQRDGGAHGVGRGRDRALGQHAPGRGWCAARCRSG